MPVASLRIGNKFSLLNGANNNPATKPPAGKATSFKGVRNMSNGPLAASLTSGNQP
jgi:hypothetical protein